MDISRAALFGKLNPTLFKAIEGATVFCKLRGNPYVELVHWLHQIVNLADSDIHRIARHFGLNMSVLQNDMTAYMATLPNGASSISDFSHHVTESIERAWVFSTLYFNAPMIRGAYLLAVLIRTAEYRAALYGISAEFRKISLNDVGQFEEAVIGSPESTEQAADGSDFSVSTPGEASGAMAGGDAQGKSMLARFCTDMTELARQGKIDPVVGRTEEVRNMIDVLLRRRQNNPLLTGEAGVGKTAVVEGLALAIAQGDVPPALKQVRLLSLDVGVLLAGASMKGEFESRLKGVIEEASKSKQPIIMFVDEIHTLVGAGGAQGTGDAANLLKPALARGTLRTVGATTWTEYKKHIEKDPALTRRFQVLQVAEPEELKAIEMVRGVRDIFMQHHQVEILDEAVQAAVKLSHRYIPSRQLPDKAISLLDTACARVAFSLSSPPAQVEFMSRKLDALALEKSLLDREVQFGAEHDARVKGIELQIADTQQELAVLEQQWQQERALAEEIQKLRMAQTDPQANVEQLRDQIRSKEYDLCQIQGEHPLVYDQVGEDVVAAIVADWTGIPVGKMVSDEMQNILALDQKLAARVMGQDHALQQIARRVQTSYAKLLDPNKPVGVFMLVGPSGVGKTETALALAEQMYGGEQNLITINMSEYQESHTVSTLKGAPPGYVGYGEGGVLTEAVRKRPYSVILLDEIEKAHPDVYEIFFQVFDKGWMEDGEGRYIDFKNTTILLTSNAASDMIVALCQDEDLLPEAEALKGSIGAELLKVFPAAFMGRITAIPYYPLTTSSLRMIVDAQLSKVQKRLQENHGIDLIFDEPVSQFIVDSCLSSDTGARLVIGYIEKNILPKLSLLILTNMGEQKKIHKIIVKLDNDNVLFQAE